MSDFFFILFFSLSVISPGHGALADRKENSSFPAAHLGSRGGFAELRDAVPIAYGTEGFYYPSTASQWVSVWILILRASAKNCFGGKR